MDENPDVQQAETTAEVSSTENETTTETQEVTQDDQEVKTVPYDRFQEVINKNKEKDRKLAEYEAMMAAQPKAPSDPKRDTIKQELKSYLEELAPELGYISKKELEEREADKQLQSEIGSLKSKYDGKDGRPKYNHEKVLEFAKTKYIGDLEIAYKQMHEAELMNWAISKALGTKPTKTEASDGSGGSVTTSRDDLMKAAANGDDNAQKLLIKQLIQ